MVTPSHVYGMEMPSPWREQKPKGREEVQAAAPGFCTSEEGEAWGFANRGDVQGRDANSSLLYTKIAYVAFS